MKELIQTQSLKSSVLVLRAINHKLRQKILGIIEEHGSVTVTDLYIKLRREQSDVSQHLAILRRAGVVTATRDGKRIFYSLDHRRLEAINRLTDKLSV